MSICSRMVSNDSASFSLDEIKAQLAALGYGDVGEDRLEQFHTDISQLMSGKTFTCHQKSTMSFSGRQSSLPKAV